MKQARIVFDIYEFDELSEEFRERAINWIVGALLEENYEDMSPAVRRGVDRANAMQTPWFTPAYIWDYAHDEIIAMLREYLFYRNGDIYNMDGIKLHGGIVEKSWDVK